MKPLILAAWCLIWMLQAPSVSAAEPGLVVHDGGASEEAIAGLAERVMGHAPARMLGVAEAAAFGPDRVLLTGAGETRRCADGARSPEEWEAGWAEAEEAASFGDTSLAADHLSHFAEAARQLPCLARPVEQEQLTRLYRSWAALAAHAGDRAGAIEQFLALLSVVPEQERLLEYSAEVEAVFSEALRHASGQERAVLSLRASPQSPLQVWIDGRLRTDETLSLSPGDHLVQVRHGAGLTSFVLTLAPGARPGIWSPGALLGAALDGEDASALEPHLGRLLSAVAAAHGVDGLLLLAAGSPERGWTFDRESGLLPVEPARLQPPTAEAPRAHLALLASVGVGWPSGPGLLAGPVPGFSLEVGSERAVLASIGLRLQPPSAERGGGPVPLVHAGLRARWQRSRLAVDVGGEGLWITYDASPAAGEPARGVGGAGVVGLQLLPLESGALRVGLRLSVGGLAILAAGRGPALGSRLHLHAGLELGGALSLPGPRRD